MQFARINDNGQVTLPAEVLQKLGVRKGGKIAFVERDGQITVANGNLAAFENLQVAFAGEAERLDVHTVEDVVAMVDEVRAEMWEERYARHD